MYTVSKRMEIAVAHNLKLPYESKCENLHGHNLIVTVHFASDKLTDFGMVADFKHIKNCIHDKLDHTYLNEVLNADSQDGLINPTAENLARWILIKINNSEINSCGLCYRVDVQESEGNVASYISDTVAKKYGLTVVA